MKTFAALVAIASPCVASAATHHADPLTYQALLADLQPGDTLNLAPGVYLQGLPIDSKHGTATTPIVISGPDDRSAVFMARDDANTVEIKDSSYVTIRSLTLDGAKTDSAIALDSRGPTHHITVEDLRIVNYGAQQQVVGISTKGPAWNWIIRRNLILGAGTGIYLGNSDGAAPFVGGLIEYNVIVDSLGYNLQIKHQLPRPLGIGLPTSPSTTLVRHNVFSKGINASTGDDARPNVLIGHLPLSGGGMNDHYEIYGNFFYQNPTDVLLQAEGNLVVHDNVLVNAGGSAISIRPHHDVPREVAVYHNTVVARNGGIRVDGSATTAVQRIVGNVVFAKLPIVGPGQADNVTGDYDEAAEELIAPFAPIGTLDLYPKAGHLAGPAISLRRFARYTDGAKDFDGRERTGASRGAYEVSNAPHKRPSLQMKPR